MENTTSNSNIDLKNKNKTNKIMMVLIVLLFGFCGFLIWQNIQLKNVVAEKEIVYVEVSAERDNVKAELEDMLAQYNALKTNNGEIKAELEVEKAKIEELLKNIKGKDWSINKLKKETESLRKIMKGFVVQIDSLNTLNKELRAEKEVVQGELKTEKNRTQNLTKENEGLTSKVTIASYLKTTGMKSYGVKVKSDNTGKELDRAKKIDKIRTEFSVLKNEIAPSGEKWIYVRILSPDGKVLSEKTDDSNKFDFNGVKGLYSAKKLINYQNQEMSVTIDWKKIDEFPLGEYNVEVYADGVDIGKTKFTLK
jgi:DNA repair exonuclease SbcCD ATPase subunit